jgi:hypothetical protein
MHEPTPTPIPIHDLSAGDPSVAKDEAPEEDPRTPRTASSGIEQAIDILIGLVTLGASATSSVVHGSEEPTPATDSATLVTGAAAGFLIEGLRAAGAMLTALERTVVAPAASAAGTAAERPEVRELLQHWQQSWDEQRKRSDPAPPKPFAAASGARRGVMEQLDVTDLALEHVDIQRIAETVDINPLVDRLDMEALTDRIDMDALVARLDIEALVGQVDIAAITADVIDQLDIPDLIREVTAETTTESVRSIRLRGVGADRDHEGGRPPPAPRPR